MDNNKKDDDANIHQEKMDAKKVSKTYINVE